MDASSPGSAHDSSVWQSSPICNHMKELCDAGEHVFLLGNIIILILTSNDEQLSVDIICKHFF